MIDDLTTMNHIFFGRLHFSHWGYVLEIDQDLVAHTLQMVKFKGEYCSTTTPPTMGEKISVIFGPPTK